MTRKRQVLAAGALFCVSLLLSCGGGGGQGGSPPPPLPSAITAVSVSCAASVVPVSQTNQCTATVRGTGNFSSLVHWSVSTIAGGNATVGTISSSGFYTAPASVPTPFTVTIGATSDADATKTGSASLIVAGTIVTTSQTIMAVSGGTITLPDGSNVTIAPGVLPSDESVTLSQVSYLPDQPPNKAITSVGPGLVLAFATPVHFSTRASDIRNAFRKGAAVHATGNSDQSAFVFSVNTINNNASALSGSVPAVDFFDTSSMNTFVGTNGSYNSTAAIVSGGIDFNLLSGFAKRAIAEIRFAAMNITNPTGILPLIPGPVTLGQDSKLNPKWQTYVGCPSGKTLLLVHGMLSSVEGGALSDGAFPAVLANDLKTFGNYDSVIGFDYNWLQAIDTSGASLKDFLDSLTACSTMTEIDIEAHSEGVPVSMWAAAHTTAKVSHLISLGGPIMGTPVANDAALLGAIVFVSTFFIPSNVVLDTLSDVLNSPFIKDLRVSVPGDGEKLDNIRNALSSKNIQVITSAGNVPRLVIDGFTFPFDWAAPRMKTIYFDGVVPVTSALAFQPLTAQSQSPQSVLKVYPLTPSAVGHTELESDPATIANVAVQKTPKPPSLTISSVLDSCTSDFFCGAPPGTSFLIGGNKSMGYSRSGTITEYSIDSSGQVLPFGVVASANGLLPETPYQTVCPTSPFARSYFAVDGPTQISSNAVTEYIFGTCTDPGFTATCTINGSASPTTGLVNISPLYQAIPNPTAGGNCAWSGAFNTGRGYTCAAGFTPRSPGVYSESVTVTSGSNSVTLGCPAFTVQDFDLAVTPSSATVAPGGTVQFYVTASSVNGFGGQITFSWWPQLPPGLSFAYSPVSGCYVSAGGSCSVIGSLNVSAGTGTTDIDLRFGGTHAPNAETKSVTASVHVPGTAKVYVNNHGSNSVSVIDAKNDTVSTTVPVGPGPGPIRLSSSGAKAYVGNYNSNTVSVISTASNSVTNTVQVGNGPCNIGLTPNGGTLYISNQNANSVSVLDTSSDSVVHTISVGIQPCALAISPDGKKVYVANQGAGSVSVISTTSNSVTQTISVGASPYWVAFTPNGSKAYITNSSSSSNSVSVIDVATDSELKRIPVGNMPVNVAVRADGSKAYVANYGFSYAPATISVIDVATDTVIKDVSVGGFGPVALEFVPGGTKLYVSYYGSPYALGDIGVIDSATDTLTNSFGVGNNPIFIAFTPDGSKAYVSNTNSGTLSVIDTATEKVTQTISVGTQPVDIAIRP